MIFKLGPIQLAAFGLLAMAARDCGNARKYWQAIAWWTFALFYAWVMTQLHERTEPGQ